MPGPNRSASQRDLESWLSALQPEQLPELIAEFKRLRAQQAEQAGELSQTQQRVTELERKLESLELDAQRVHRYLDEFEVPRTLCFDSDYEPGGRNRQASELSLLGRIELVLEDEEAEEEEEREDE